MTLFFLWHIFWCYFEWYHFLKTIIRLKFFDFRRINEKSVWCCGCLPCTPLRIAATAGHAACVAYLIAQGAEVDLVDVKGQTALYVAVVNGHLDCVRILLEAGADPNGSRHHRSTPLYHAARVGRVDILQELIRWDEATYKPLTLTSSRFIDVLYPTNKICFYFIFTVLCWITSFY